MASAASITRVLSGSTPVRATRARPNASTVSTSSKTEHSASTVPSPPSAIGVASASTPAAAKPSLRAAAAAVALSEFLRLAGHASALGLMLCRSLGQRWRGVVAALRLVGGDSPRHLAQPRERQPFASEEDQPDTDADRRLDRLEAEAERDPLPVVDAVADKGRRHRDLYEADVARPERNDR